MSKKETDGSFGPIAESDGAYHRKLNKNLVSIYWLWDYARDPGSQTLGLLPQEIVDLQVLGEVFDPAQFDDQHAPWFTAHDWGVQSRPANGRATPKGTIKNQRFECDP